MNIGGSCSVWLLPYNLQRAIDQEMRDLAKYVMKLKSDSRISVMATGQVANGLISSCLLTFYFTTQSMPLQTMLNKDY